MKIAVWNLIVRTETCEVEKNRTKYNVQMVIRRLINILLTLEK